MGVATSQLCSERKQLEDKIERLRMQNIEAIRDKSEAKNKIWNLLEKVGSLEKKNEGLGRHLSDVKDVATQAKMEAQAARA
jgi:regulator of replication initiation timing